VPDELKTLWNMGLVHITTHNLKRGVGDLRNSTKYQKNKRQFHTKKEEEKKSIYETDARDRIELAVRCERLLHVEGLTVTLR
jgi:hypothetical protein